jgi:hypothetical protein
MRALQPLLILALVLFFGTQADAARRGEIGQRAPDQRAPGQRAPELLLGRLEMVWGDSGPDAPQAATRLRVTVVDDAGRRHGLDPDQALRAADDLHALFGKRVAVARVASGAGSRVDAIVPIGDLVATKAAEFPTKIAGATRWITLMCRFPDIAGASRDLAYFQSIYGTAPTQLGHYWDEVSYGKISLTGSSAHDWKTLPQPRSVYVPIDPATIRKMRISAGCSRTASPCTTPMSISRRMAARRA